MRPSWSCCVEPAGRPAGHLRVREGRAPATLGPAAGSPQRERGRMAGPQAGLAAPELLTKGGAGELPVYRACYLVRKQPSVLRHTVISLNSF